MIDLQVQILGNENLELFLPESERDVVKNELERFGEINTWHKMFEQYWANGMYQPISPESHMVGLTTDPYIIVEDATMEENGDHICYGFMWHYPNYMLESVTEKLLDGQKVQLQRHYHFKDEGERIQSHFN